MIRRVSLSILALAFASQALADPVPKPAEPAKAERDPVRCKVYQVTGSLISRKKVCKSASEWRQEAADLQSIGDNKICSGSASCSGGTGP